jgi:DNA-binding MarR family transcriptional regulator
MSHDDFHLTLDAQLCHRLYTASNAFTRAYRPLLNALDLTYPQYLVMLALWEGDQIPVSQLMAKTHMDGGSLTQILNKLQHKALLALDIDPQDRRQRILTLTPQGQALKQQAREVPAQIACRLKGLSTAELWSLAGLLDRLNADLLAE